MGTDIVPQLDFRKDLYYEIRTGGGPLTSRTSSWTLDRVQSRVTSYRRTPVEIGRGDPGLLSPQPVTVDDVTGQIFPSAPSFLDDRWRGRTVAGKRPSPRRPEVPPQGLVYGPDTSTTAETKGGGDGSGLTRTCNLHLQPGSVWMTKFLRLSGLLSTETDVSEVGS